MQWVRLEVTFHLWEWKLNQNKLIPFGRPAVSERWVKDLVISDRAQTEWY